MRHKEQVELIKHSQDFILDFQCKCFSEIDTCPKCGGKTYKQGKFTSEFHDVYTDHKVTIARMRCTCGWTSNTSVKGLYGSSSHPELEKLQSYNAAKNSFPKASEILDNHCCGARTVNNHVNLMRVVEKIGDVLCQHKKSNEWATIPSTKASDLVINVDGGHVQTKEDNKHSFEEIVSTVYKPEDVVIKPSGDKEIPNKISVASALEDKQVTIKKLVVNSCLKLGMTKETSIIALTDGAKNCWSITNHLLPYCKNITNILDWFHIAKKFKERESIISAEQKAAYDKAKWNLWHGRPITAIIRLNQVKELMTDVITLEKLKELIGYIENNEKNIVNYHIRKIKQLPFTSQLAETSVNSVINERQKNKKMQWTRAGANNILQIRTSMYSNNWDQDWLAINDKLYKKVA